MAKKGKYAFWSGDSQGGLTPETLRFQATQNYINKCYNIIEVDLCLI